MKKITFQRLISFLLTERTVKSYERLSNNQFDLMDSPLGQTGWCDFIGESQWGECTNIFQNAEEAKHLFQNLFCISDIQQIEKKYGVQIDSSTIPNPQGSVWREYQVNTKTRIRRELDKKLSKNYPYLEKSYSSKGTLIVGIFDPTFGGFTRDIEISNGYLSILATEIQSLFEQSSFDNVILVDAMSPFDQDQENSTYVLKRT